MTRSVGTVIVNNLSRGLITEATGLNFPDNAVTDALNVVFDPKGSVRRRRGLDIDGTATAIGYEPGDGVIQEFLWEAVALTGGYTFLVLQIGNQIYFFELTNETSLSQNVQPNQISLEDFRVSSSSPPKDTPCSFSSGAGHLYIAHPSCDPILVRWNELEGQFETAKISLKIRDFEGLDEDENVDLEPESLTTKHHYNLRNQGWNKKVLTGDVDNEVGEGGRLGGTPEGSCLSPWSPV